MDERLITQEQIKEFDEAARELFMAYCVAFRVDKLLDWLNAILVKLTERKESK